MATGRSSPSLASCSRASSTAHDQTSLASDIELVTLVAAVENAVSEHSRQSSSIDLGATRPSTAAAAYHARAQTTRLRGDAPSLQSDEPSWIRRILLDSWVCEWAAICFSIVCLIALAFVVSLYRGGPIPKLGSGLTLNAIISVLSTASRASLVFVVSATIGQLKWCWLKNSGRKIHDVQTMDDASRGPLGALGVLASWTGGSLAALGSIITLLMIAFGPFLQQVVEYPARNLTQPDANVLAPRNLAYTHHLRPTDDVEATSPWERNLELLRVLEAGVWSSPKPFDQEPICSTGQCLWYPFLSVGWCSSCEGRTSSATISNCRIDDIVQRKGNLSEYCVLDLGNGAKFSLLRNLVVGLEENNHTRLEANFTSELIWPLSYGNPGGILSNFDAPELSSGPTFILGVRNPIITIGQAIVKVESGRDKDYLNSNVLRVVEASQCVLNPCEKTLSLTILNGLTTWREEGVTNDGDIIVKNLSINYPKGPQILTTLCWSAESLEPNLGNFDEESYSVDKNKRAFCPVEDYAYEIQRSLQGQYDGMLAANISDGRYVDIYGLDANARDRNERFYMHQSGRYNTVGPQSTRNLSQRVESIAVALTNWGLQTTNDTVPGTGWEEKPFSYVRVRYQWFALPVFLESVTLVLLILTYKKSRHEDVPLWKTSVLALIYHAVDELRGQETLATERLSGMELTAKKTDVQLVKSEDGVNSLSKRSGYRPVDQDQDG
jgi:hypothetical protein